MGKLRLNRRELFRATSAVGAGLSISHPHTVSGQPTIETQSTDDSDDGDVLIIKDCEPWNIPAAETALSELGIPYDVLTMEEAVNSFSGRTAASDYKAVVLPSSQPTEYYLSMAELRPRLDGFVEAGGTLVAHMGNRGEPCNSVTDMPIEVTSDFSRYEAWQSSGTDTADDLQEITISEPDHRIMQQFTDVDLSGWSSAFTSFGEITDIPSDATVLASLATPDDATVFVEYPKGEGAVLATMLIMEWPYGDGTQFDGDKAFLKAVLEYAVGNDSTPTEVKLTADVEEPTVRSPVTLQVTEPVGPEYTYQWEVTAAPTNEPLTLLDEKVDTSASRPDRSTVLTPPEMGIYQVAVTVEEDQEVIGQDTMTIRVEPNRFADWDFETEFLSEDNSATPSFDLARFDEAETAAELAEKYAPTINFHPGERFFPTRYEAYFENSHIQINDRAQTVAENVTAIDIGNEDLDPAYDPTAEDNHLYLQGAESDFERYQEAYPRAVYASVTGTTVPGGTPPLAPREDTSYIALTYWCFYLFDPKKADGLGNTIKAYLSEHTSDTETFTILFSESGPEWIGAAQHYSGDFMRWEKIGSGESHIEIYPSLGAHSTFFVNTEQYEGGVPAQPRYSPDEISTEVREYDINIDVPDSARPLPGSNVIADETGSGTVWSYNGTGTTNDYELLLLSDDGGSATFNGRFISDIDEEVDWVTDEGGKLPQARGKRWEDPAPWILDRKLRETDILSARGQRTQLGSNPFSVNTAFTGDGAEIEGTVFNNGSKPHTFIVEVVVSRPDTGDIVSEKSHYVNLPTDSMYRKAASDTKYPFGLINYRSREDVTIPLDDIASTGQEYKIEIDFRTYPSEIGIEEDRLDRTVRTTSLDPTVSASIDSTIVGQLDRTIDTASLVLSIGKAIGRGTSRWLDPVMRVGDMTSDSQRHTNITSNHAVEPGDAVGQNITVTNTGPEEHRFLVEMQTKGPRGVSFGGDEATKVVNLDPEETKTVEVTTTVPVDVPGGSYDLTSIVWLEDSAEDRFTKLDEETEPNAIHVEKPVSEIEVLSTPEDAEVTLNGDRIGQTPVTVERPASRYSVLVSKAEYVPEVKQFLHENGTTTVMFDLEPSSITGVADNSMIDGVDQQLDEFPLELLAASSATAVGLVYLTVRLLSADDEQIDRPNE